MIYDEGGRQQRRRAIHVGSIFFVHSPDILLTPPIISMWRYADTITIYVEGGRQQRRRDKLSLFFYFFANPPDILLTPRVHDF